MGPWIPWGTLWGAVPLSNLNSEVRGPNRAFPPSGSGLDPVAYPKEKSDLQGVHGTGWPAMGCYSGPITKTTARFGLLVERAVASIWTSEHFFQSIFLKLVREKLLPRRASNLPNCSLVQNITNLNKTARSFAQNCSFARRASSRFQTHLTFSSSEF